MVFVSGLNLTLFPFARVGLWFGCPRFMVIGTLARVLAMGDGITLTGGESALGMKLSRCGSLALGRIPTTVIHHSVASYEGSVGAKWMEEPHP